MKPIAILSTLIRAVALRSHASFADLMSIASRELHDDDNKSERQSSPVNSSTPTNSTSDHKVASFPHKSATSGLGSIKIQTDLPSLTCDRDFFAPTKANWDASRTGQAYLEWIIGFDKESQDWINRDSEIGFFAKDVLEWPIVIECSPEEKGCNPMPDCDGIFSRVRDKEQARQILFVFVSVDNANMKAGVVKEQTLAAQVGVASKAMDLAHTFFWLHDDDVDRKCAIEAGLIKGVISAILATASAAIPAAVAVEGGAVAGAAGAASRVPWSQVASDMGKSAVNNGPINLVTNIPTFVMGDALDRELCKHRANAPKDAEAIDEKMLNSIIEKAGSDYRKGIDESMYIVNYGTIRDDGSSVLSALIYDGIFAELTDDERDMLVNYPSKLEANMKKHFTNAMISQSMKNGMCYLHCTNQPPNQGEANMATSRFEPVTGTYCQVQCWQNFEVRKSKNLKMFGVDDLSKEGNRFGITADEFINAAFTHWQENRYNQERYFPTIDEAIMGNNGTSSSGSYMPICYNDMVLHDFSNKTNAQDRFLPCVCGDQFGNETTQFLHEAGLYQWTDADKGKNIAESCVRSFQTDLYRPVPSYLSLCGLGYHFPVRGDKELGIPRDHRHRIGDGSDYYCDDLLQQATELAERGTSDVDLDCTLCLSDTGRAIMKLQRSYVHHNSADAYWVYRSFKGLCAANCEYWYRDGNNTDTLEGIWDEWEKGSDST